MRKHCRPVRLRVCGPYRDSKSVRYKTAARLRRDRPQVLARSEEILDGDFRDNYVGKYMNSLTKTGLTSQKFEHRFAKNSAEDCVLRVPFQVPPLASIAIVLNPFRNNDLLETPGSGKKTAKERERPRFRHIQPLARSMFVLVVPALLCSCLSYEHQHIVDRAANTPIK
jgi:hypothetical protein